MFDHVITNIGVAIQINLCELFLEEFTTEVILRSTMKTNTAFRDVLGDGLFGLGHLFLIPVGRSVGASLTSWEDMIVWLQPLSISSDV